MRHYDPQKKSLAIIIAGLLTTVPTSSISGYITACHSPNLARNSEGTEITIDENGWYSNNQNANNGHESHQTNSQQRSNSSQHGDYVGSCPSGLEPDVDPPTVVFCHDNGGNYRQTLLEKIHAYNTPVLMGAPVVGGNGTLSDDVTHWSIIETHANCITEGKGDGIHIHFENGNDDYQITIHCANKSSSSSETYRATYRATLDALYPVSHSIVFDMALDDSSVKAAYDDCLDNSKGGGDEVYHYESEQNSNFRILMGCSATYATALNTAISNYNTALAADEDKPILLPEGSLDDYQVDAAYNDCLDTNLGAGYSVNPSNGVAGRFGMLELIE